MKRLFVSLLFVCLAFACAFAYAEGEAAFLEPIEGIVFPAGEKYPVYYGPGSDYDRMANGKAAVSTNDWIHVYGEETSSTLNAHGSPYSSVLIEYEISEGILSMGLYRRLNAMGKAASHQSSPERYPWKAGLLTLIFMIALICNIYIGKSIMRMGFSLFKAGHLKIRPLFTTSSFL